MATYFSVYMHGSIAGSPVVSRFDYKSPIGQDIPGADMFEASQFLASEFDEAVWRQGLRPITHNSYKVHEYRVVPRNDTFELFYEQPIVAQSQWPEGDDGSQVLGAGMTVNFLYHYKAALFNLNPATKPPVRGMLRWSPVTTEVLDGQGLALAQHNAGNRIAGSLGLVAGAFLPMPTWIADAIPDFTVPLFLAGRLKENYIPPVRVAGVVVTPKVHLGWGFSELASVETRPHLGRSKSREN